MSGIDGPDGAYSEALEVNEEILEIVERIKDKLNINSFDMFLPIEYKFQIVAGTNYKIKIQVDEDGMCIVVEIYQSLGDSNDDLEVTCIKTGIKVEDDF